MIPSSSASSSSLVIRTSDPLYPTTTLCAVLSVAAVLLAGCSVGPRYKRPVASLQPYHNAPAIESRTAALPTPSLDTWWTGFNDAELTKIIERALAQNLDLAASFARVQQAQAAAREASANRKPEFGLAGSDAASRQSIATPIGR